MNIVPLIVGGVFVVAGIVLLVVHGRISKRQKEQAAFEEPTPYVRNAGIGLLLFGVYHLARFFVDPA